MKTAGFLHSHREKREEKAAGDGPQPCPGPKANTAGTARWAGCTWCRAALTAGLRAGAPPWLPHRCSPKCGCLQTAAHGSARWGRAGPGRPPEAGRAVSGTWCVPSREQARAPQVEKSPPRSLSTRRREAGTSLSAGRAAVPAARRAAPLPCGAPSPGPAVRGRAEEAPPALKFRQGRARGHGRQPPASRRSPFPAETAATGRTPHTEGPLPARPPAGTYLGSHAVPGAATPFPPLPSLPTAAGSFSACAPARQRRPSPLSRHGRGARRRQPIGCTARPGAARRGPRDRPARRCLRAGGRGSDAAAEASEPGGARSLSPLFTLICGWCPQSASIAAEGQYQGAAEPIQTLESGPANDSCC